MSFQADSFRNLPPTTLGIIVLCCTLYVAQLIGDVELHHVTMCPRAVVYLHEYYRLITSALFHANLMHIAMNMMSTAAIATMLERQLGTLRLLLIILWAILVTNVVYVAAALFLSGVLGKDDLMYQHAVGFSGVLFHLSVLECNMGPSSHTARSVFGFFHVPAYIYPVVL